VLDVQTVVSNANRMPKDVFIIEALHRIARFLAAISMILIESALTKINWFRPIMASMTELRSARPMAARPSSGQPTSG